MTQRQTSEADGAVILEAQRITHLYQGRGEQGRSGHAPVVLEEVSLQIRAGELVALLGPSGSGKSTLLRILAGLIRPTQGEVRVHGQLLRGPTPSCALVFQSFALFPWLTVLQNVALGLEALGLPRLQRLKRALAIIDMIGLDGFEEAYPKELSGGMRQRVGFARALAVEPELLLLDEPFSALDVLTAANLRRELLQLWYQAKIPTRAMLLVTHNIDEAVSMADRLLILGADPGHLRAEVQGLPRGQREPHSPAYTHLVDLLYRLMTSPDEDGAALLAAEEPALVQRGQPRPTRPYQTLPHVAPADMIGLLELVQARGGRADLAELGRELQLELDELLPLVDAADLLQLARPEEGDLVLTAVGRQLAEADVQEEKRLFRQQALARIALLRRIAEDLAAAPGHRVDEERYLERLREHFSEGEAEAQLQTIIDWGRYAEIFTYQEEAGVFALETDEETAEQPTEAAGETRRSNIR
ncbi:MAG: AAA-associated domain-containing protein [Thermogemmatispora sp.]|uniref:ABC transporter ATP-binding protein n=1 Tax=Thermogemmatispora sp. TaxID=1968838 RepID=UPI00262E9E76|nr:nitrate/sulfonate/bicarbonate ABC transporter ATP-binding protein [Thermogemmatispora sp.]MBX5458465.1 AAA-associated domain-containing protein [Thermogemmatispora sp.]